MTWSLELSRGMKGKVLRQLKAVEDEIDELIAQDGFPSDLAFPEARFKHGYCFYLEGWIIHVSNSGNHDR